MWRATVRGLLAHRFRLALTALAVVLGVAFVAGTYVLTDTMNRTFDNLFRDATAGVDVYVRAEAAFEVEGFGERDRVPEELLDTVLLVDGVAFAEGSVGGFAQLVDEEGEAIAPVGPPTLGVSWPEHPELSGLSVREGRPPERDGEVAIDAATAAKYGFRVGDRVQILFPGPSEEFEVVGIAGFGEADNIAGATLAAFDLRTAQRLLRAEGEFDAIEVAAEEGVSAVELRDRIAQVLPAGVEAETGEAVAEEQSDSLKEGLSFFNTALLVFAGISLFVGAFIIFNTFNILVTQRTRELALLRALGASGAQVRWAVLGEALVVGLVASGVGLGAGVLLAMGLRELLRAFGIDLPSSSLQVLPRTIVAAVLGGVLVTVAASVFPARRAARIPPVAALRDADTVRPLSVRRRSLSGGLVVAAGVTALLLGLSGQAGNALALVGAGVGLIFLGVAVVSAVLARPLARAIGAPLARLARVPGKLGRENAMRNPRRTASTSAALMVGLALVGTFLVLGSSLKESVGATLEETFRADFLLRPTAQFGSFSPEVADRLRAIPEVGVVSPTRVGQWREPGTGGTRFLTAVDPATVEQVTELDVREGTVAALAEGGVLVHEGVAEDRGLRVGDVVEMEFAATGVVHQQVVGIFGEEGFVGADYLVSLETFDRNFAKDLDDFVLVKVAPGASPDQARAAMGPVLEAFPNVEVQDQVEVREDAERQIDQLLGLVNALLGLAVLIALLGIVNTLALSVYERTREIGLLRAVGMERRQVRSMIRWESVIIALLGGVLGLAVGVFFGWALVRALGEEGVSRLALPGAQLGMFLAVAGFLGVVAAVGPARRAARIDVLQAIAYE